MGSYGSAIECDPRRILHMSMSERKSACIYVDYSYTTCIHVPGRLFHGNEGEWNVVSGATAGTCHEGHHICVRLHMGGDEWYAWTSTVNNMCSTHPTQCFFKCLARAPRRRRGTCKTFKNGPFRLLYNRSCPAVA